MALMIGSLLYFSSPFKHSTNSNGYSTEEFQFVGQWGTHVDAPSHFFEGKRAVDQIPVEEMVLPLAVIDIHEKAAQNPDYILLVEDILSLEDQNGRIPAGAFVALRTDWSGFHWRS